MLVYIWFRFEWTYGAAAVIAVFHDAIITIVIFDRIRENLKLMRKTALEPLINISVNRTLSRTALTSGLTFLTVLSLYLFGGEVLNGFSFALVVGIIIGTYSSVLVASRILIWYQGVLDRLKVARGPVLCGGGRDRRLSRCDHHGRPVLLVQQGDFAGGLAAGSDRRSGKVMV